MCMSLPSRGPFPSYIPTHPLTTLMVRLSVVQCFFLSRTKTPWWHPPTSQSHERLRSVKKPKSYMFAANTSP